MLPETMPVMSEPEDELHSDQNVDAGSVCPGFAIPGLATENTADDLHRYFSRRRLTAQVHLHSAENVHTSISGPEAQDRAELEQFVHRIFARAYDANVKEFMPQLMSLRNDSGELLAVCGLRHAENSSLFLERYLPQPVEHVISAQSGQPVVRNDIVEIGNLAVAHPETARSLLASISLYLHGTSTTWGVFTGIPSLRNALSKLNMHLLPLGWASLAHLAESERADWGRYYDEKPQVMAVKRLAPPTCASAA